MVGVVIGLCSLRHPVIWSISCSLNLGTNTNQKTGYVRSYIEEGVVPSCRGDMMEKSERKDYRGRGRGGEETID